VDFGQVLYNTASTNTQVFTLTNVGDVATANPVVLTLAGGVANYIEVVSTTCPVSPATLAAGVSCTATTRVKQVSSTGLKSAGTIRASTTPEFSAEIFTATAQIVNPAALFLTASGTSFTPTFAGIPGGQVTLTLVNGTSGSDSANTRQNSGTVTVNQPTGSADFTLSAGDSGTSTDCAYLAAQTADGTFTLDGGASCLEYVDFTPQSVGALTSTFSITASPGGTTAVVTLTGTGKSALTASPTGGDGTVLASRAAVGSGGATFVFTNNGAATGLLRATLSGTNASLFVITNDTCTGQSLIESNECTVTVEFLGTLNTTTAQSANLTVTDGTAINTAVSYIKAN